jgi:hypothetical protein
MPNNKILLMSKVIPILDIFIFFLSKLLKGFFLAGLWFLFQEEFWNTALYNSIDLNSIWNDVINLFNFNFKSGLPPPPKINDGGVGFVIGLAI